MSNKNRIIKFCAILGVFFIQFFFLFAIYKEKINHYAIPYIICFIIIMLIVVYKKFPLHHNEFSFAKIHLIIWIPVSAIITYVLNNRLGLGSVFSVGIVGTAGSCLTLLNPRSDYLKQIAGPIYCGAFIGMTSMDFKYVYLMILVSGIFTAILFSLTQTLFVGIGGKLGTLAFIGFLLSILLFKLLLN